MTAVTELFNYLDRDSREYEEFLQNLIRSHGDVPYDAEDVEKTRNAFVSTVNNHLNSSQSRYMGLRLLRSILPRLPKDVLSKYCLLWISKATQALESIRSTEDEFRDSCRVIAICILLTKDVPEIRKQIAAQHVKQLLIALCNKTDERRDSVKSYLLSILLHNFSETCKHSQALVKRWVLSHVDSTANGAMYNIAWSYAWLTQVEARSSKANASESNSTSWTRNQTLICNSLHDIITRLFPGLMELEHVSVEEKLELPDVSEENVIQYYFKQKQRFANLCCLLSYMLRGFDKKNSVCPREILKLVCRGLAIQPIDLNDRNTVREQILYLILSKLHITLLDVLDAMISGFKEQLVPFGSTILQLFPQALQWTETVPDDRVTISGKKPFRDVRIRAYKCLNSWLINTNALSGIETVADECLSFILKDIVPEKDRVLLTIQKTQDLSKNALKRLRDSQYEKGAHLNTGISSSREQYLDADVCEVALDVLQNIFFNSGTLLKQTFFKTVQNVVIPLLYDCYLSSSEEKFYKENPGCRLLLFRVLRALQMNPHSLLPLPTQYSLELFQMALNDNDSRVTQEAKVALAEVEKIVHPYAPSIQLTQVETIQNEFVAVDQIPQETNETAEDVETVANEIAEPTPSKRLKVDDSRSEKSVPSNENGGPNADKPPINETNENPSEEVNRESDEIAQTSDKTTAETETNSKAELIDKGIVAESKSPFDVVKEDEDIAVEKMDATAEEVDRDAENVAETADGAKEDRLGGEEEGEAIDAMLQSFQDVPKADD